MRKTARISQSSTAKYLGTKESNHDERENIRIKIYFTVFNSTWNQPWGNYASI